MDNKDRKRGKLEGKRKGKAKNASGSGSGSGSGKKKGDKKKSQCKCRVFKARFIFSIQHIHNLEVLPVLIWKMISNLNQLQFLLWMTIIFSLLPVVTALSKEDPFLDISFKIFS